MRKQKSIPASKVARASRFATTGLKIGGNMIKHYAKKATNANVDVNTLHEENAKDVYDLLSTLKGGALKVAQMLSMDKNLLPDAYNKKFELSQFSAPPLSGPLILRTFSKYLGQQPNDLFDQFDANATNAASIGQVHRASKDGKSLAVKIQYPGVKEGLKSDLRLARPVASTIMKVPLSELNQYMEEVEEKLIEETDYQLELRRSMELTQKMSHFEELIFPKYYPEWSGDKILTMDWIDGLHLSEYLETNPDQEDRNRIGQLLWDFYSYQIFKLREAHADPHPGNFLVTPDGKLGVLDFGCVKVIPDDFSYAYFDLLRQEVLTDQVEFENRLYRLDLLRKSDNPEDAALLIETFKESIGLLARPLSAPTFDFSDKAYFKSIYQLGENFSRNARLRKLSGRGDKNAIYVNRTLFGLYNLLHLLEAEIDTSVPQS